jgi:hypothetical protein
VPIDYARPLIDSRNTPLADKNGFHVRLLTNTNYNLVVVNDQLNYLAPDMLVLQVLKLQKEAQRK